MNDPRTLAADLRDYYNHQFIGRGWPYINDAATFIESMFPLHDAWLKAAPPCPTCGGFGGWPSFRCGNPTPHDPHPSIVNTEDGPKQVQCSGSSPSIPCPDCTDGTQPFDKWTAGLVALATQGCGLLVIERHRQISEEGWTPDHDDQHDDGVLVRAALCYADKAAVQAQGHRNVGDLRPVWPWGESWWKPSDDPIRNLVKAGALIAAEIDRLHRQIGGAR